jgi:hypothetical protein
MIVSIPVLSPTLADEIGVAAFTDKRTLRFEGR